MQHSFRTYLKKRFIKPWLNRRMPTSEAITLSQRSIFIVPSKTGWMFTLLLTLLLITAINYQNSLIYGLVFWLFSIALSAMIFTYRNLSGLIIQTAHPVEGFSGTTIEVPVRISSLKQSHYELYLSWTVEDPNKNITSDLITNAEMNNSQTIQIPFKLGKRGQLHTPRLRIQTRYPFGLYTCWTLISLNTPGIVYPIPLDRDRALGQGSQDELDSHSTMTVGNDEFSELRSYQVGDPLKHIAWKYVAKGQGMLTKKYDPQSYSLKWFDWNSLHGIPKEQRLQYITGWILRAHEEGQSYGLKLPNMTINPNSKPYDPQHKKQCLTQLALFDVVIDQRVQQ